MPENKKTDLGPEDVLGEHTSGRVLFNNDTATNNVNIVTGEESMTDGIIGEAMEAIETEAEARKEKRKEYGDEDAPLVAISVPGEVQYERRKGPYDVQPFFHRTIWGLEKHVAFREAWVSDNYEVDVSADYESGKLTVTVSRSEN